MKALREVVALLKDIRNILSDLRYLAMTGTRAALPEDEWVAKRRASQAR